MNEDCEECKKRRALFYVYDTITEEHYWLCEKCIITEEHNRDNIIIEIIEDDYDFAVDEYGSIQYFLLLSSDITEDDREEILETL